MLLKGRLIGDASKGGLDQPQGPLMGEDSVGKLRQGTFGCPPFWPHYVVEGKAIART